MIKCNKIYTKEEKKLRRRGIIALCVLLAVSFVIGFVFGMFLPRRKSNVTASAQSVLARNEDYQKYFYEYYGYYWYDLISISSKSRVITVSMSVSQEGDQNQLVLGRNLMISVFEFSTGRRNFAVIENITAPISETGLSQYIISGTPTIFQGVTVSSTSAFGFSSGLFNSSVTFDSSQRMTYNWATLSVRTSLRPSLSDPFWFSPINSFSDNTDPIAFPSTYILFGSIGSGIYTEQQYRQYGLDQFNQGQIQGYNSGYTAGVADSDNNTFLSLFSAVIDAPIIAFTSLLDFEILGFNMRNVMLSLLTACLAVAVLRLFAGLGK